MSTALALIGFVFVGVAMAAGGFAVAILHSAMNTPAEPERADDLKKNESLRRLGRQLANESRRRGPNRTPAAFGIEPPEPLGDTQTVWR